MAGLEPATFWSRTRRATKLRYIPIRLAPCTILSASVPQTKRAAGLRYARRGEPFPAHDYSRERIPGIVTERRLPVLLLEESQIVDPQRRY